MARILGIESSCDETAAAVVEDGERILSSVVASQLEVHSKYGGVVPELASREHLRSVVPVVREAMALAGVGWGDLDAVAATYGPGLAGALLVGLTYAKAICFATGLPLIGVNHIEGHIHAVILEAKQRGTPVEFPALAMIVSGGHTHMFAASGTGYKLLGRTRDDAAGEAFDKVAKLLGFGYPGGPVLDRLARFGDPDAVRFTSAKMKGNALDFSFSGLKTAVLRWVQARPMEDEIAARKALLAKCSVPTDEQWLAVTPEATLGLLASFQHAVVEELLRHALGATSLMENARSLIVSGGVACNSGLREALNARSIGMPVHFPSRGLSTDNAVMIAAAAFGKLERREFAGFDAAAEPNLILAL
jgi:N6-L-threonylcarbamoyladenine synthase